LISARQAEFLQREVPGIIVPDDVRADMASVDELRHMPKECG
jgi:hypothetical protein